MPESERQGYNQERRSKKSRLWLFTIGGTKDGYIRETEVLGIKPPYSCVLGKYTATELRPQPKDEYKCVLIMRMLGEVKCQQQQAQSACGSWNTILYWRKSHLVLRNNKYEMSMDWPSKKPHVFGPMTLTIAYIGRRNPGGPGFAVK